MMHDLLEYEIVFQALAVRKKVAQGNSPEK